MLKNTQETYGSVTLTLHWLIALLVIGMLIFGFILPTLPEKPSTAALIALHKSIGMTILMLMVIRIAWRLMNPQPLMPITVPRWEHIAARSVQLFLYLGLLAMPITGWLMSSLAGRSVSWWGWFNMALPVAQNKNLAREFFTAHTVTAWVLIGLLVLHLGAAVKHHFIEKNNVLRRMLPGYKPTHFLRD